MRAEKLCEEMSNMHLGDGPSPSHAWCGEEAPVSSGVRRPQPWWPGPHPFSGYPHQGPYHPQAPPPPPAWGGPNMFGPSPMMFGPSSPPMMFGPMFGPPAWHSGMIGPKKMRQMGMRMRQLAGSEDLRQQWRERRQQLWRQFASENGLAESSDEEKAERKQRKKQWKAHLGLLAGDERGERCGGQRHKLWREFLQTQGLLPERGSEAVGEQCCPPQAKQADQSTENTRKEPASKGPKVAWADEKKATEADEATPDESDECPRSGGGRRWQEFLDSQAGPATSSESESEEDTQKAAEGEKVPFVNNPRAMWHLQMMLLHRRLMKRCLEGKGAEGRGGRRCGRWRKAMLDAGYSPEVIRAMRMWRHGPTGRPRHCWSAGADQSNQSEAHGTGWSEDESKTARCGWRKMHRQWRRQHLGHMSPCMFNPQTM